MKKWFVAAAALVVSGIPAAYGASASKETPKPATAAQAQSADDEAAKACKAERASGAEAFAKKYGTNHNLKNAFGKCVSAKSKDDKDEKDEDKDEKSSEAAKACKAERASGAEAFAKKYGTNHNLKNAFGKCVSAKSKAKTKD